jgi:hypothetical protein
MQVYKSLAKVNFEAISRARRLISERATRFILNTQEHIFMHPLRDGVFA